MDKVFIFITIAVVIIGFTFGIGLLMTNLIIWIANGLFNYDLSDKFWYVFLAYFVISSMLSSNITVDKN